MEMKQVKVKLISHGGYDGLKHLTFPQFVDGLEHPVLNYIDVTMRELERIGYDFNKGQVGEIPDCAKDSDCLTFFQGSEAEVIA